MHTQAEATQHTNMHILRDTSHNIPADTHHIHTHAHGTQPTHAHVHNLKDSLSCTLLHSPTKKERKKEKKKEGQLKTISCQLVLLLVHNLLHWKQTAWERQSEQCKIKTVKSNLSYILLYCSFLHQFTMRSVFHLCKHTYMQFSNSVWSARQEIKYLGLHKIG